MTDQAPTPPPSDAPAPTAPDAPPLAEVDAPALNGSPVEDQTAKEATEWAEAVKNAAPMAMPEIIADGGRLSARTSASPEAEIKLPTSETETETADAPDAPPTEQEKAGEESFVARANAERERLYKTRTEQVKAQQFEQMQQENRVVRERQREMFTPEQIGERLRKDPFGFMREHGVGLQDLNKELDNGKASGPEPGVTKEVFELQKQVAATNAQLRQMQESASQNTQVHERQQALMTLQSGLDEYKESYPGLHALFGGEQSHTTPAEQVLIGLERAQQAGRPMSANEVAGRLENEARTHFERLTTAYKPPPAQTAVTQPPPPTAVHHTAGITNQIAAPVRRPRAITRAEEISQAAQLIRFI